MTIDVCPPPPCTGAPRRQLFRRLLIQLSKPTRNYDLSLGTHSLRARPVMQLLLHTSNGSGIKRPAGGAEQGTDLAWSCCKCLAALPYAFSLTIEQLVHVFNSFGLENNLEPPRRVRTSPDQVLPVWLAIEIIPTTGSLVVSATPSFFREKLARATFFPILA